MSQERTGDAATPRLLDVRELRVAFPMADGDLEAICGVDFGIGRGEVLGLVGESGSGKSVTMRAVLGLLGPRAKVAGSIRFRGEEQMGHPRGALRRARGSRVAMIFQDPLTALNPVLTIGEQIVEAIRIHDRSVSRRAAGDRAIELLEMVAVPFPQRRVHQYPHEFSGGMRQRAMIAMAMANGPELLIADEPTTALDVTIQAQIMEVLQRLREEQGVGLVLITHDLGLVAGMADRIAVMYAGRIVEHGSVDEIFYRPKHPYTHGLLGSLPSMHADVARLAAIEGAPPSLSARPPGCAFHPRCEAASPVCRTEDPRLRRLGASEVACHHPKNADARDGRANAANSDVSTS